MRVGIYIDGTWLLHHTARLQDPNRVGKWSADWKNLPITVLRQFFDDITDIDLTVTFYATSVRSDDDQDGIDKKLRFMDVLLDLGYDAHLFETSRVIRGGEEFEQEKCVDMAVGLAAACDAAKDVIDAAILITGDRDFEPVIDRVRLYQKKVGLVTSRANSWCPPEDMVDFKISFIEDFRELLRRKSAWCQCDDHYGPRNIFVDTQEQPAFNPEAFWCDDCRKRFGIQV